MSSGADNGPGKGKRALGTRLSHAARDRKLTLGGVNPVVQRASTVIVESASKLFEPGGFESARPGLRLSARTGHGLDRLRELIEIGFDANGYICGAKITQCTFLAYI